MDKNVEEMSSAELAEERLRLEREALAVERERLASARAHAAAEAKLSRAGHPKLIVALVSVLLLLSFAGGFLSGSAWSGGRSAENSQYKERLAQALSRLEDLTGGAVSAPTNVLMSVTAPAGKPSADGEHKNVALVVFQ